MFSAFEKRTWQTMQHVAPVEWHPRNRVVLHVQDLQIAACLQMPDFIHVSYAIACNRKHPRICKLFHPYKRKVSRVRLCGDASWR